MSEPRAVWHLLADAAGLLSMGTLRTVDPEWARSAERLVAEIDEAAKRRPGEYAKRMAEEVGRG